MSDENVIVTSAFVWKDQIYGLSEQGHLVMFDTQTGAWTLRSTNDIYSAATANSFKKTTVLPVEPSRHNQAIAKKDETKEMLLTLKSMMTPYNIFLVVSGIAALVLAYKIP